MLTTAAVQAKAAAYFTKVTSALSKRPTLDGKPMKRIVPKPLEAEKRVPKYLDAKALGMAPAGSRITGKSKAFVFKPTDSTASAHKVERHLIGKGYKRTDVSQASRGGSLFKYHHPDGKSQVFMNADGPNVKKITHHRLDMALRKGVMAGVEESEGSDGFKNAETARAALMVKNESELYSKARKLKNAAQLAAVAKAFVRSPAGRTWQRELAAKFATIDWQEVFDQVNEPEGSGEVDVDVHDLARHSHD